MPANSLPSADARKETVGRNGRTLDRAAPVLVPVNETKLAIVAVMQELDRPVSSIELQAMWAEHEAWAEHKALKSVDYHLCTLVKAKVVEVVYRPELHYCLVSKAEVGEPSFRERCR